MNACLTPAFAQMEDDRSWRSEPEFKTILAALDQKRFQDALRLVEPYLTSMRDFDGIYIWSEEAFNGLGKYARAVQILFDGLDSAKDKRTISSKLAERSLEGVYFEGFVFWWCQTLLCFESLKYWRDSGPCLYLAEAADVVGRSKESEALRLVGRHLAGNIVLDTAMRARVRNLIEDRESHKKVVQDIVGEIRSRQLLPTLASRVGL